MLRRCWIRGVLLLSVIVAMSVARATLGAQTPPANQGAKGQPAAPGQNPTLDSARAIRGASLRVSLITYGPSDEVWERFGHDAIAIRDTITGQDFAYNWGTFDFKQPNFYTRFLTGETSYWIAAWPTPDFNADYRVRQNRTIRVQQLAMTSVEKAALLEYVSWNLLEANMYYRYDYYQDNCATRARDALDWVLKGRVKVALDSGTTNMTWRSETERVTASVYPVYAGIELALGRNADKKQNAWAISFMPERLAEAATGIILKNEAGQRYNLVAHDSVIFMSTRVPMPIDPPERLAMAALLGLTVAGIIAMLADSRVRILRGLLVTFAALWYGVGGILGTALLLAGTATKHVPYMGSNTTLWQIHPLLLFAALFVPVALLRREATTTPRLLAGLSALFSVFGALLQIIPYFNQHSGVVLAVMVPIHVALAVAVLRMPVVLPKRRASGAAAMPRAA